MKIINSSIIPRAIVNYGFTFEEAIFEGIDNVLDVANKETKIDCFMYPVNRDISYMICDNSGGASMDEIFSLKKERSYLENYTNVEIMKKKIGLFGAGSFSHTNVSNNIWFFTKVQGEFKAINLTKLVETGDFKKEVFEEVVPENIIPKEFLNKCKLNLDVYDTIVYVDKVKIASNQEIKDFQLDISLIHKGILGNQIIKNLRCTYEKKLKGGYRIAFNGILLEPLDLFYRDTKTSKHIATLKITLKQLLEFGDQFEEEILGKYLSLYSQTFGDKALDLLMNESIEIECYGLAKEYINSQKNINWKDYVICNSETSGFWLFRNGRRIDNPLPILPIKLSHPSFNGFRAAITFSPIFDDFFGIQTNKNRAIISTEFKNALTTLFAQYEERNGMDILEVAKSYKFDRLIEQQKLWEDETYKFNINKLKGLKDWRKAELIARFYFEQRGYTVKDVTDRQVGYDLYVEKEVNFKKYVDIKFDKNGDGSFTLTDNEYLLASQQRESYIICIVTFNKKSAIIRLVENPIENIKFKEVRSWKSDSKYEAQEDYIELGVCFS